MRVLDKHIFIFRENTYIVIRKVIQHYKLDEKIGHIIGKDVGLFLELAAYAIVTENNAGRYYPDYAYHHPPFTEGMMGYSDSKVSGFLREVDRKSTRVLKC